MTDTTSTQRNEAWRKKQMEKGLKEVRGIYATAEEETHIKNYARKLKKRLAKQRGLENG